MHRNVFSVFFLFPLGVALLPIFFIPGIPVSADLQKGMLAAIVLGAALVAAALPLVLSRMRPAVSFPPLALFALPLFGVVLLSAGMHGGIGRNFFGLGLEMGTGGSFMLFIAALMLGSLANRSHIRLFYQVYVSAVCILAVAAGCFVLFGSTQGALQFFLWPQSSFALTAALVAAALLADASQRWQRLLFGAAALLLLCACAVFFHPAAVIAAGAVLALGSILLSVAALRNRTTLPFVAALSALVLIGLFFSGFRGAVTLPPDVRLTPAATYAVGSPVYFRTLAGALIGSGPDTFSVAWERNRPVQFNLTPLWNNTFREGFSTALTWLVMIGFLGVLFALWIPAAFLWSASTMLLRGRGALHTDGLLAVSGALLCFVCIAAALYTVDLPLFLLCGVVFGFCARLLASKVPRTVSRPLAARAASAAGAAALGGLVLFVAFYQFGGAYYHGAGIAAFENGNISGSKKLLAESTAFWPASPYLRDESRAALEVVRTQASAPGTGKEEIQKGIAETRRLADAAVAAAPNDFSAHVSEGSILITLVIAGVVELGPDAAASLKRAQALAPTRPDIPYLQAVLSHALGRDTDALSYAQQSLLLKPDYEPALAFLKDRGQ